MDQKKETRKRGEATTSAEPKPVSTKVAKEAGEKIPAVKAKKDKLSPPVEDVVENGNGKKKPEAVSKAKKPQKNGVAGTGNKKEEKKDAAAAKKAKGSEEKEGDDDIAKSSEEIPEPDAVNEMEVDETAEGKEQPNEKPKEEKVAKEPVAAKAASNSDKSRKVATDKAAKSKKEGSADKVGKEKPSAPPAKTATASVNGTKKGPKAKAKPLDSASDEEAEKPTEDTKKTKQAVKRKSDSSVEDVENGAQDSKKANSSSEPSSDADDNDSKDSDDSKSPKAAEPAVKTAKAVKEVKGKAPAKVVNNQGQGDASQKASKPQVKAPAPAATKAKKNLKEDVADRKSYALRSKVKK
jgi:hypothetical protein